MLCQMFVEERKVGIDDGARRDRLRREVVPRGSAQPRRARIRVGGQKEGCAAGMIGDRGLIGIGAGVGAGLCVIGGAKGIGNLAGHAMEGIARQPEAGGRIGTNMIIAAALIEGFTFFALVIALQLAGKITGL